MESASKLETPVVGIAGGTSCTMCVATSGAMFIVMKRTLRCMEDELVAVRCTEGGLKVRR
jgi:hypothetical protein